jgi:HEAT repeat protein
MVDSLFYDVLKMDRGTQYYYETVQQAHDPKNFCYRCSPDPYLADKCVDAIVHLGQAQYARIEGEAQVVLLLSEVLLEDPSALARSEAAVALAALGSRMDVPPGVYVHDRGDRYLEILKILDGMHDVNGHRHDDTPGTRQAVAAMIDEVGLLQFDDLLTTKNGLKVFPARPYIVNETDPTLRASIERAILRRASALVRASLVAAIEDRNSYVRIDALAGLKAMKDAQAIDAVTGHLAGGPDAHPESHPRVRVAMADYLGTVGGLAGPSSAKAIDALVDLVEDPDGSVRHQARLALAALAGRDLGRGRAVWVAWAASRNGTAAPPTMPMPETSPVAAGGGTPAPAPADAPASGEDRKTRVRVSSPSPR